MWTATRLSLIHILDFFDDEGYEEEPYINEDEEPQIAEDAETDGDED